MGRICGEGLASTDGVCSDGPPLLTVVGRTYNCDAAVFSFSSETDPGISSAFAFTYDQVARSNLTSIVKKAGRCLVRRTGISTSRSQQPTPPLKPLFHIVMATGAPFLAPRLYGRYCSVSIAIYNLRSGMIVVFCFFLFRNNCCVSQFI